MVVKVVLMVVVRFLVRMISKVMVISDGEGGVEDD